MATTSWDGAPVHTCDELPAIGAALPAFTVVGTDLADITRDTVAGSRVILNIFPSIDTGVCAMSVRQFNKLATDLPGVKVLCVSKDLPFALGRFCGAEGIENVTTASAFRSSFGEDMGVTMVDGPFAGLLARAVVIADATGKVIYTQLVPAIGDEPDYQAALAALA
ncbi:MAG: thiol peroxidase [Actinomycetia bacterium]|nr:thiol peroxidase [Actinomycetes bacterium]